MTVLYKPNPVFNTTEKEITYQKGVINLPADIRKEIQKLMTFEKVPTQETLVKRAKKIALCIDEGLKKLNQENKISFPDLEYGYEGRPSCYVWDIVIDGCPNFFQRRLEDVMMISFYRPVYIFSENILLWAYDEESEWSHRRKALLTEDTRFQEFLDGKITEDQILSYPTL